MNASVSCGIRIAIGWGMICALFLWPPIEHALGGEPGSLLVTERLKQLLAEQEHRASDPGYWTSLADLYLDLGDEESGNEAKSLLAYSEGARFASRAIALQETSAEAHYLYAANVGSAAQIKGLVASAMTVNELKSHVRRALQLKQDYAPALHMMGMMLEELPWFMGGDGEAALAHLKRAVIADPDDGHARLDLAKAYLKRNNQAAAKAELERIVQRPVATASPAAFRHAEEAARLLKSISPR